MAMDVNSRSILSMIARYFALKRSTLEDRLQLQKTIYLLQASRLRLGYGFSWYKHGPYSQDLADDAFAVLSAERRKYDVETKAWEFDDGTIAKLEDFKEFISGFRNNHTQLELVASIDFMERRWKETWDSDAELRRKLKERKGRLFNKQDIRKEDVSAAVLSWKKLPKIEKKS